LLERWISEDGTNIKIITITATGHIKLVACKINWHIYGANWQQVVLVGRVLSWMAAAEAREKEMKPIIYWFHPQATTLLFSASLICTSLPTSWQNNNQIPLLGAV